MEQMSIKKRKTQKNPSGQPEVNNLPAIIAGVLVLLLCAAVTLFRPRFLNAVSYQTYDTILRKIAVPPQSGQIVIVDIDDASMHELGQWPWPRHVVARLTDMLSRAGAKVIAFDVMFAEKDRTSPVEIIRTWKQFFSTNVAVVNMPLEFEDYDKVLEKAFSRGQVVLGCFMHFSSQKDSLDVDSGFLNKQDPNYRGQYLLKGTPDRHFIHHADDMEISLTNLVAVTQTGFFNTWKDQDDIIRRTPLVVAYGPFRMYASLALQALRMYLNQSRFTVVYDDEGVRGIKHIQLREKVIPTDESGRMVINFRSEHFPSISAVDVYAGRADMKMLRDKIVFIGTSAAGLHDMRNTPFQSDLPGVEIQATVLDNMLAGDMLREPRWMDVATLFGMLAGGLLLIFIVIHTRALFSVLVVIFCMVYPVLLSIFFLRQFNLVVVPMTMMLAWLLTYLAVTIVKYWQKEVVADFNEKFRVVNESLEREVITRKRAEEEARKARNAALQAAESKSQFLANMSHEIRTPMNGVIGMTELALKTALTPRQLNYLSKIHVSAKALLRIINDILDFSKIEAGKLDIERTDFQLRGVLEELADLFSEKAAEQEVDLVIHADSSVPGALYGDPLRLRQVLVNLTGNALKFTAEGLVTVKVSRTEPERPGDVLEKVRLRFEVRDSGIGIAEEHIGKLFSSFTQVDGSTSRKYGGTGLGLTISKQLISLMGGAIQVESVLGEGTAFSFVLPFDCQPAECETVYDIPENLQGKNVLLLDRNETCRAAMQDMLSSWGFQISETSSVEQAQQMIRAFSDEGNPFVFALVDAAMLPENEPLNALVAETSTRPIFIARSISEQNATAFEQAGISAYTTKPVKPTELFDALLKAFGLYSDQRVAVGKESLGFDADRFYGLRILLAEDNAINQEVARENLNAVGIEVDTAGNGVEVLDLLEKHAYDAILMDVQMPEMDGYTATSRIRKRTDDLRTIPIIAMTAHAMTGDMEKCLQAGMDDYVTKPLEPKKLFEAIERRVPKKEGAVALVVPEDESQRPEVGEQKADRELSVWIDYEGGLRRVNGNVQLYRRLLDDFSRVYADAVDQMKECLEQSDYDALSKRVHTLKGTAANLSLKAVQEAATVFEAQVIKADRTELNEGVTVLEQALAETLTALQGMAGDAEPETQKQTEPKLSLRLDEILISLDGLKGELISGSSHAMSAMKTIHPDLCLIEGVETLVEKLNREIMNFDYSHAIETLKELTGHLEKRSD